MCLPPVELFTNGRSKSLKFAARNDRFKPEADNRNSLPMKPDYSSLDFSILDVVATRAQSLDQILAGGAVRQVALQLARRRAGTSPSESADETVKERLQALRWAGKIEFDRATRRWAMVQDTL